jgi:multidrug efflux system membrane fusion protein
VVSKEQQQLQVSNQGQAAGSIKADQAAIEAARVNLGYTRIYSPIDGVVGLRQVDPGNIVNTGDTNGLVVITQIHPIAIIFTLPEDQLPQVQQAMKGGRKLVVEAYDRSDSHKIASGTLLTIDNQIDTTTGTAKLKAVFTNADNSLFPNEFVNVRLILSQRSNSIVVPTAAVETGSQGDYVFVVNPGPTPANKRKNLPGATPTNATTGAHAARAVQQQPSQGRNGKQRAQYHADMVNVKVDFTVGIESVIETGPLHAGQQVVVDGQEKLVDGGNVTPQLARSIPSGNNTSGLDDSSSSVSAPPPASATPNPNQPTGSSAPANAGGH